MQELIWDRRIWNKGKRRIAANDTTMHKIVSDVGNFKITPNDDRYSALVESIIFQQLAGKAADAILNRFKSLYAGRLPTPKIFLKTPINKVRRAGISPQKYSYIRDLCMRIENGLLELDGIDVLPDEEVIKVLDDVKGIGRWTAEMFLMFSLGRTDIVPFDDLGLRKAVQKAYSLRKLPEKDTLERLSRKWAPYGTIATLYLWRSLSK